MVQPSVNQRAKLLSTSAIAGGSRRISKILLLPFRCGDDGAELAVSFVARGDQTSARPRTSGSSCRGRSTRCRQVPAEPVLRGTRPAPRAGSGRARRRARRRSRSGAPRARARAAIVDFPMPESATNAASISTALACRTVSPRRAQRRRQEVADHEDPEHLDAAPGVVPGLHGSAVRADLELDDAVVALNRDSNCNPDV